MADLEAPEGTLHQGYSDIDTLHQQKDSHDPLHQHTPSDVTEEAKRKHSLTRKARELFDSTIQKYGVRLSRVMQEIEDHLSAVHSTEADEQVHSIHVLKDAYRRYLALSDEIREYLQRQNSDESAHELISHNLIAKTIRQRIESVLGSPPTLRVYETESISHQSMTERNIARTSRKSKMSTMKSSASVILARQKAKLEAARANMEFASREAELLKEKARLEAESIIKNADIAATLRNLKAEQENKVASVEMKAVLDELEGTNEDVSDVSESSVYQRTANYVQNQNQRKGDTATQSLYVHDETSLQALNVPHHEARVRATSRLSQGCHGNQDTAIDISKYLIRRDIVTDRLLKFSDKPETYLSWKNTFRDIMVEIGVKPSEEVDLMIKWLGPQSSSQVTSIKTANAGNHERALAKHGKEWTPSMEAQREWNML